MRRSTARSSAPAMCCSARSLLAFIAGMFLAGRMVVPIQALRAGAARIGAGDLAQRIDIKTGDEVEALANQFNDMAGRLQESYADLEKKVDDRTRELTESLEQQTATSEVLRVIASSRGELEPVFNVILASANRHVRSKLRHDVLREDDGYRAAARQGHLPASAEQMWWTRRCRSAAARRALRPRRILRHAPRSRCRFGNRAG